MKSKLGYLIQVSLNRKIKTKWFAIANLLLAILIVGVINIDSIISFFGGDFSEKQEVYVIDDTKEVYTTFTSNLDAMSLGMSDGEESDFKITPYEKTVDDAKKEIEKNKKLIVVYLENDSENYLKATVLSEGFIDTINYQMIQTSLQNTKVAYALSKTNISTEEMNRIYSTIKVDRFYLDDTKKSEDESMETIMTTVFPVFILPFFMLTLFLVQMIGAEVNDEKTTRGMEIIISNVPPKTHFFSKIIAGNAFVLLQGLLLLFYGALGIGTRVLLGGNSIVNGLGTEVGKMLGQVMESGLGDKLIYVLPLSIVLMLITFLAYSLVAGILASMTTNIEDFQQLQTPIIIVSLVGYYLSFMASMFKGALFIKVLAFVPFVSAILAPSLLVLGQIGIAEVIGALLIMILVVYLLIRYGLKVYKVGILNYSSEGLWKKMLKAIKG